MKPSTAPPISSWTKGQKAQFKGVHNREIRTIFNIDQTTLPYVDKPARGCGKDRTAVFRRKDIPKRTTASCAPGSTISC